LGPVKDRIAGLETRLTALRPDTPEGYLLLGEEVMQEASTPDDRDLARHLLVVALTQWTLRREASPPTVGASACRALAAMTDDPEIKRWLLALGASLSPEPALEGATAAGAAPASDPNALQLATAMGLIRSGEGRKGERILERPGVAALLEDMDRIIQPGSGGGAARLRELARQYPWCPQCRNRRTVRSAEGVHVCPACDGVPGPKMDQQELIDHLRAESVLLSGVQRSWAAQMVADGGAPLRDLDAGEVASVLRVDASKTVWRDGRWVSPTPARPPAASEGSSPAGGEAGR
jgi:hypothetical protein